MDLDVVTTVLPTSSHQNIGLVIGMLSNAVKIVGLTTKYRVHATTFITISIGG